jgi:hypothetical protein
MGTKWAVKDNGAVQLNLFSSAPSGAEGQIYYNSTDKKLYYHNGTDWVESGLLFTVYDDFEDGIIDSSKWTFYLFANSHCGEGNGQIWWSTQTSGEQPYLRTVQNVDNSGKWQFYVGAGARGNAAGCALSVIVTDGVTDVTLITFTTYCTADTVEKVCDLRLNFVGTNVSGSGTFLTARVGGSIDNVNPERVTINQSLSSLTPPYYLKFKIAMTGGSVLQAAKGGLYFVTRPVGAYL